MGTSPVSAMVILSLLFLVSLPSLPEASAMDLGDWLLSPNFSPLFNSCEVAECGKGSCRSSGQNIMGFVCDCDAGWRQLHNSSGFRFLPCVIPNCTFDMECTNSSVAAPPLASPPQSDKNHSFLDPCDWAFCGEGSCKKTGSFNHDCDCKQGYTNLFNITSFPCFTECALEGQCSELGISLSNQTSNSSAPNLPDRGSNSGAHDGMLHWSFMLVTVLIASVSILLLV